MSSVLVEGKIVQKEFFEKKQKDIFTIEIKDKTIKCFHEDKTKEPEFGKSYWLRFRIRYPLVGSPHKIREVRTDENGDAIITGNAYTPAEDGYYYLYCDIIEPKIYSKDRPDWNYLTQISGEMTFEIVEINMEDARTIRIIEWDNQYQTDGVDIVIEANKKIIYAFIWANDSLPTINENVLSKFYLNCSTIELSQINKMDIEHAVYSNSRIYGKIISKKRKQDNEFWYIIDTNILPIKLHDKSEFEIGDYICAVGRIDLYIVDLANGDYLFEYDGLEP